MRSPFLDHLIEALNTKFDKYGSIIYKIHAFVSSVIGMGKVEGNNKIKEIIHKFRNDLLTLGNAFEEYSRRERQWKVVPKENQSDTRFSFA